MTWSAILADGASKPWWYRGLRIGIWNAVQSRPNFTLLGYPQNVFGTIERGFNGGWVVGKVVINFYMFAVVIDCTDQPHTAFDTSKIG